MEELAEHIFSYPVLNVTANVNEEKALANRAEMLKLVDELNGHLDWSTNQGQDKYQDLHLSRGMALARDRIALLLDDGSPFLELLPLVGLNLPGSTPCASIVCGIGLVNGTLSLVTANVATIEGGSTNEGTVIKNERCAEIAFENGLPTVSLVQSAGANLPQQFKVFHRGGNQFRRMAMKSAAFMPTCAVVFGSSTAGGAYVPGMSDNIIMVKNQAQVFLGGPPLVKMATGEVSTAEEIGGADMHAKISGVADQLALDEFDALEKTREWIASINYPKPVLPETTNSAIVPPIYNEDEILNVCSADIRQPWDIHELIARITDGSRFMEFKPFYGPGIVTGWAYIHNFPVGIIGNNSVLFPPESHKATQFIKLCNGRNTPIIFLQNITGFMVGKKYEEAGIIKAGSLFIDAVSNSQVPHITIMCGSSFGAGNYAMNGRPYKPRFLFSWPNSKCSVMGAEQLSGVMDQVARENAKRSKKVLDEEKHMAKINALRDNIETSASVWLTSGHGIDDGVIDPRDTRTTLAFCLNVVYNTKVKGNPGFGGVSRL